MLFCRKNPANIWQFHKKFVYLQRQSIAIDYAAESGEQARIETTPFKSRHIGVTFTFHSVF